MRISARSGHLLRRHPAIRFGTSRPAISARTGHFSPPFRNGWPDSGKAGLDGSFFPLGKRLLVNALSLSPDGNPGFKENHDKEKINAKD